MNEVGFVVNKLRPWKLMMFEVGPFRSSVEVIEFTNGSEREAANFFLIAAGNGKGKTTALEAVYFLFRTLSSEFPADTDLSHEFLNEPDARMQLDLLLTLEGQNLPSRDILLSISWGDVGSAGMSGWKTHPLEDGFATAWLRYGWSRDPASGKLSAQALEVPQMPGEDDFCGWRTQEEATTVLQRFLFAISSERSLSWPGFNEELSSLPTVLYFASGRDIGRVESQQIGIVRPATPRYQIAHRFEGESGLWYASLDNLLVWYFWISSKDFESIRNVVHKLVFAGSPTKYIQREPQRDPPRTLIVNEGREHPLNKLSSGERSLILFALRYGAHRTRHTIVLIDEIELHLHPGFQRSLMNLLKRELAENNGMTVIFSTHSLEVMDCFAYEVQEPELCKGGVLLLERD